MYSSLETLAKIYRKEEKCNQMIMTMTTVWKIIVFPYQFPVIYVGQTAWASKGQFCCGVRHAA